MKTLFVRGLDLVLAVLLGSLAAIVAFAAWLVIATSLALSADLSNYLENALVDHVLGGTAYTQPTNLYVALHTAAPTETCATGEVSGNGYARQLTTFGAASGGSASNNSAESWTASGGNWGTITHFSIWDAASAGNCIAYDALTTSRVVNDGDTLNLATTALTFALD